MRAVGAFLLMLCYLAGGHAWHCAEGPQLYGAVQIDAGQGKVVALNRYYAHFLMDDRWYQMSTLRFRHVTAGPAGLWAAGSASGVYKFVGSHFLQACGLSMEQVDAGGDEQVVGVVNTHAYCLTSTNATAFYGTGSLSWTDQSADFKYISCSPKHGCWGIDKNDGIYFTRSISPTTCSNSGWTRISGAAKMVEAGTDGNVFVVTQEGGVYQRTGVSPTLPEGTGWKHISMSMEINHVAYDLRTLWLVTKSGLILKCAQ